jgi:hypothetical protein
MRDGRRPRVSPGPEHFNAPEARPGGSPQGERSREKERRREAARPGPEEVRDPPTRSKPGSFAELERPHLTSGWSRPFGVAGVRRVAGRALRGEAGAVSLELPAGLRVRGSGVSSGGAKPQESSGRSGALRRARTERTHEGRKASRRVKLAEPGALAFGVHEVAGSGLRLVESGLIGDGGSRRLVVSASGSR